MLISETNEINEQGKEFDIASSISAQLPFFACNNIFIDKGYQNDISQYVYCMDFGISPYNGSYGDQPKKWVDKYFIIKNATNKVQEKMNRKAQKEQNLK